MRKKWKLWQALFSWATKSPWTVTAAMKLNFLAPSKKSNDKSRQLTKNQRHHLVDKLHIVKVMGFPVVMYGCGSCTIKKAENWRIDTFKCGTGEDSWESHGQKRDQTSQSYRKSTLNIHWKDWCWSSSTLAIWYKELTHWKRPWCGERLKIGGEGDHRKWDGWMASLTQRTRVWAGSGRRLRTGKTGMLQSIGMQRVGHDLVTEQ